MTNSNDPKNSGIEQSDDLIAELARIVADDAKRSTVSESIDERAQVTAAARSAPSPRRSFEQTVPTPNPETAFTPTFVETPEPRTDAFSPLHERTPVEPTPVVPKPAVPFSQIGEGVTPIENSRFEPPKGNFEQTPTSVDKTEVPFEFDFSSNIEKGFQEPSFDAPNLQEDGTASFEQPAPVAAGGDDVAIDLDAIAALIQDVEDQAPVQRPDFGAIPVPQAPDQRVVQETPVDTHVQATEPALEDAFAVSPSFSEEIAQAEQPARKDDPLSEIEDLIAGTRSPVEPAPQSPAPADAAEAAILAALAAAAPTVATQQARPSVRASVATPPAQLEPRIQPSAPTASDPVFAAAPVTAQDIGNERKEPPVDQRRGGMLPVFASIAAILLLAIVGGVGYWMFFGQNTDPIIPTVAAQNTEVKLEPEVSQSADTSSSVFDALDGNAENSSDEKIVSRDETSGSSSTNIARIVTPTSTSNGLTNRKVKTVTVLADGTIVSGTEASAGAEQLPQGVRPNVPAVSSDTVATETGDEIASVLNSIASGDTAVTPEPATVEPVTIDDPTAPSPPARPAGLGTNQPLATAVAPASTTTSQPISLLPQTATTPTASSASNSGGTTTGVSAPFYVQLASQRNVETARSTASKLQRQFPSQLGSSAIDINRVDLGDKGVYFRVRVPANSLADANALCSNLQANGGDCFVRNN